MTMDRQQLARTLDAGRSSALNCFDTTKDIAAASERISERGSGKLLFANQYLNQCIVMKILETKRQGQHRSYSIDTMLYFPYNKENIYEGGDAVLFSDPKRNAQLRHKCGMNFRDPEQLEALERDFRILDMLDELPTVDPFLLRSKAQQLLLEDEIDPLYFDLPASEWEAIQKPIREKIDALVRKAIGSVDAKESAVVAAHVSRFLGKIWDARDIESIEDFVDSLEIPRDRAPELFFAWKAICYYQARAKQIEPALVKLFSWIGDKVNALPADMTSLHPERQEIIRAELAALKKRMREFYRDTTVILTNYEDSYREFIEKGNPRPFKEFLAQADEHYLTLAACLSANAHAVNLLDDQERRCPPPFFIEQHRELLNCLLTVYGIERNTVMAA